MRSERPYTVFSKSCPALVRSAVLAAAVALASTSFAQQIQPETIPLKNWSMTRTSQQALSATGSALNGTNAALVFVSITPCRIVDKRGQGGSVPSSNCGVPAATAYSMNFVSVTPPGQAVSWIAAWQDDKTWPGTVVLNAVQGGFVDNSAIVPAGADGGIQCKHISLSPKLPRAHHPLDCDSSLRSAWFSLSLST